MGSRFSDSPSKEGIARGLVAGAVAGVVSGVPSTTYALVRGRDPLAATVAAGALMFPGGRRLEPLLAAGLVAHAGISLGWGVVLSLTLPRRHTIAAGIAAGSLIAALDLGLIGRRIPAIAALETGPQIADHLVYGAVTGAVLERLRLSRGPRTA